MPETEHPLVGIIMGSRSDWPTIGKAASVLEALSMAVASVDDYHQCPRLDAPATPERVLMACERLKGR